MKQNRESVFFLTVFQTKCVIFVLLLHISSSASPSLHSCSSTIYFPRCILPSHSLPLLTSSPPLISHPSSMPAVVWEVVSGRSAGQDLGRTLAVNSLDKSCHCEGRRKCMRRFNGSLVFIILYWLFSTVTNKPNYMHANKLLGEANNYISV